jgi:hypothetical protein
LAALAIVYNKEKEMAITRIEKDRPTPKKDTPIPKKEVRIAFAFCCYFCFTPFFYDFKGIKLKKKTKTKKNQSPDPAILGRVRTRDPDPDHFGPDFDSGSGCGSAFTDSKSGARLKARIGGTSFAFFNGLF